MAFKKACVIGAGVMGSGIAAHLANAGLDVLLLDIVTAEAGLKKALEAKPAAFFSRDDAKRITVGNIDDDLHKTKDCDWVIEAVIEKLEVKQALFSKLEKAIGPKTIVSSNTSGLSIKGMLEGRGADFQKRFLVTHFFNPPRYLHLLEVVAGPTTDKAVLQSIARFGEERLGKGVVYGKDTPNFVANRIGVFAMMDIMRLMEKDGYTIEEVDAVFGPAMGRPKSAVFRTADVVGLDTFVHVAENCYESLPKDECRDVFKTPVFMQKMVANGWLGQKSKQGFYKKVGDEIESLDVKEMAYRPKQKVRYDSLGAIRNMETFAEKVKYLVHADDKAGRLAWQALSATCIYSANRLFEIADDIVQIDNAMKWGFGWDKGPFETWDAMGLRASADRMRTEGKRLPAWVDDMMNAGAQTFYQVDASGQLQYWDAAEKRYAPVKQDQRAKTFTLLKANPTHVVKDTFATSLVDLGDGILACEFHTKMNAIDPEVIQDVNAALDLCDEGKFDALVLANDGQNFSVGANILMLYLAAQQKEWGQIEHMIRSFQDLGRRLKYSSTPTVAVPFQMTFGGGAEFTMWCNRIRAHSELYMGLVEVGVGLIPGGGGNVELLARSLAGAPDDATYPTEQLIKRALETVAMAKVSTSAENARELFLLSPCDGVSLNRRFLLDIAKQDALQMVRAGFIPPKPREYRLPGRSAYATFEMALQAMREGHMISDHDFKCAMHVATVMTGGDCSPKVPVTEQSLLDLEREAFLSLCGEEKTQARIAHMLEHGKPLRN